MTARFFKYLLVLFSFFVVLTDGRNFVIDANAMVFKDGYAYFVQFRGEEGKFVGKVPVDLLKGVLYHRDTEV